MINSSNIKISIVIPVYNTGPYLDRCLESVINQTLKDIEIIVVDDASTDNSLEILRKYESLDSRVKVIHFEENKGVSAARNAGMDVAKGTFYGFIDSDDYIDENYYENLYKQSEDNDIIIGIYVQSTNYSKNYLKKGKLANNGSVFDSIWRRDFVDKYNVRFDEKKRKLSDIKFRKEVYDHNPKLLELPDQGVYYYYKQREGSITQFNKEFLEKLAKEADEKAKETQKVEILVK